MGTRVIRVDPEVYDALLAYKHGIERARGRRVSMSDAVRAVLASLEPQETPPSD